MDLWILFFSLYVVIVSGQLNDFLVLAPSSAEVSHFVNDSFIIICKSVHKDIRIQWKDPNGTARENTRGRVHIEEKPGQLALVFEHIALIDKGKWTCQAALVGGGEIKKSFELLINQKISFDNTDLVQSVKEDRDATIYCNVKGDPKPTITWYRNGDTIKFPSSKFKLLSDGLFIKSVTQSDAGEYTCRAYQISKTVTDVQEETILLRIQHKPLWCSNDTIDLQYSYVGGSVNLSCEAIAEPPPSFTWVHDGNGINSKNYQVFYDDYASTLQIQMKNASQFGDYKCKVANPLGTLEHTIKLREGHKPVEPSRFELRQQFTDGFELDIRSVRYSNIPDNMHTMGYRVEYMSESKFKFVAGNWSFALKKDFQFHKDVRFLITDLERNTTYYMRAACKNLAGLSDWTKVQIFTTPANSATRAFQVISWESLSIIGIGLTVKYLKIFSLF